MITERFSFLFKNFLTFFSDKNIFINKKKRLIVHGEMNWNCYLHNTTISSSAQWGKTHEFTDYGNRKFFFFISSIVLLNKKNFLQFLKRKFEVFFTTSNDSS